MAFSTGPTGEDRAKDWLKQETAPVSKGGPLDLGISGSHNWVVFAAGLCQNSGT
jgi:hypothetical protein